jgi:hypothetical protein
MSHFTVMNTLLKDVPALVKALNEVGFKQVEVSEEAQPLFGYRGDRRSQTAEVIIRRKYIGPSSNDIGFKRLENGTFQAIISAYDRHKYSQQWLDRVSQRYAYHVATAKLQEQGFNLIEEENQADGRIHLVARRTV